MVTASPTTHETYQKAAAEAATEPVFTHTGKRHNISGERVKEAIKDLPEADQADIWWFSQYCHTYNLGKAQKGGLLKKPNGLDFYSADSIDQLLGGGRIRRKETIEPILEAIRTFRKLEDARADQITSGFIETRLFKVIEERCLKALRRQRIMFIFGDSQIGKSRCLVEVQRRHNHGQTIYVETPSTGSLSSFLKELAKILNIPTSGKTAISESIIKTFDSRMLLIVDEAHRALIARKNSGGSAVINFLPELYNKAGCGIVISMTNEGRDELLNGHHKKTYEQIWRRRIAPLQLPNVTPADDLALFAQAYGLLPAPEAKVTISVTYTDEHGHDQTRKHSESPLALQSNVNQLEGLGVWIAILQDASDIAREQGRAIAWGAVIKAYCQSQADAEILK